MNSPSERRLPAALYRSARPLSSAVAGVLSLMAVWLRAGLSARAVAAGLAMCAVTMFGFVLNDVLDYDKDVAAGVRRPIAMGELSRRAGVAFAAGLLMVGCLLSVFVGAGESVLLATAVALAIYTPAARGVPLLKGAYVAALCLAPLYYGAVISRVSVPGSAYAVVAVFVFGRETLMDANEAKGDQLAAMKTIAVMFGSKAARWIGLVLMVAALVCLMFVTRGVLGKTAAAFAVGSLLCFVAWPRITENDRIAFSRLSMLAAAMALASS